LTCAIKSTAALSFSRRRRWISPRRKMSGTEYRPSLPAASSWRSSYGVSSMLATHFGVVLVNLPATALSFIVTCNSLSMPVAPYTSLVVMSKCCNDG